MKNPLEQLVGTWKGDKGIDLAPKPVEDENNPFYETLIIEPVEIEIENAEEQELRAVSYHQIVREKSNDQVSHDETGYWIWDCDSQKVSCAFSLPRAVSVLARGSIEAMEGGGLKFDVKAENGSKNYGILQSPFMESKATTNAFTRTLILKDDSLSYVQVTDVSIYGKEFEHKDSNALRRINPVDTDEQMMI